MGTVSLKLGDGTARFRKTSLVSALLRLLMLVSVVSTNLFALYAFTYTPPARHETDTASAFSGELSRIVREIDLSQKKLNQLVNGQLGYDTVDFSKDNSPAELELFLRRHPLPLGRDSRSGMTEMVSSIGHRCAGPLTGPLTKFVDYAIGGRCPGDSQLGLKLMSSGCEPLPRRRCLSVSAVTRPVGPPSDDGRWVKPKGKNDFVIDEVLSLGKGIRIGLDVDGGDFAVRMAEKNVTVVTVDPVNGGKGAIPLQLTIGQRLPFADSVFDLVRTGVGLEGVGMEFLMFDFDRVLRTGGVLWLDSFRFVDEKGKSALTGLIERFGFKKLKWVVGGKADGGAASGKVIVFSALLQKPARR